MAASDLNRKTASYELRPFIRAHAPLVCDWIADDQELFWLAPNTPAPATPEKVIGWTARRGRPMVLYSRNGASPIGYAELNDLPSRSDEMWIGHFILAPAMRGKGLSREMMRLLLEMAFGPLEAYRVALIVFPDNTPAIRCYEAAGLKRVGWQDKRFGTRPGTFRMLEMALKRREYEHLCQEGSDESAG